VRKDVAERDDRIAVRNSLEHLGRVLSQLAEGISRDLELTLDGGLAQAIGLVIAERTLL
jgi:hypothetical protein